MSHGKGRHDGHDEYDGVSFKMHLPSPLSDDVERVMTRVIDCAIDVHRQLGRGFSNRSTRGRCASLSRAQASRSSKRRPIEVVYEGVAIPGQRADLVVPGVVVVQLKSVERFEEVHRGQVISYLRTMGLRAGLRINFRVPLLYRGTKRIVL